MSLFTTHPESRVGQLVIYKLSEHDVKAIVQARLNAGRGTVTGNDPREGQEYPALIIADWAQYDDKLKARYEAGEITKADEARTVITWADHVRQATVNLQVFLDGTDVYWATSRSQFDGRTHGHFKQVDPSQKGPVVEVTDEWVPDAKGHWFFPNDLVNLH